MDKDTRIKRYKAVFRKTFDFLMKYAFEENNDYRAVTAAYSIASREFKDRDDRELFNDLMVAVFDEFERRERENELKPGKQENSDTARQGGSLKKDGRQYQQRACVTNGAGYAAGTARQIRLRGIES